MQPLLIYSVTYHLVGHHDNYILIIKSLYQMRRLIFICCVCLRVLRLHDFKFSGSTIAATPETTLTEAEVPTQVETTLRNLSRAFSYQHV